MNILVVTNLRSGFGDSGLNEYVRELGAHRVEVTMRFLSEDADVEHLLRDARDYARIVAAGGDGTVSAVAYALRDTGIPVLPYPAGTANLIARNLRIPIDPVELALATIAGRTVTIDLGELTIPASGGHVARQYGFSIAAGAGFDARIMEAAQPLKATLGEGAYIIGAIQNLNPTFLGVHVDARRPDRRDRGHRGAAHEPRAHPVRPRGDPRRGRAGRPLRGRGRQTDRPRQACCPAVWAALLDRLSAHPERPGLEVHTASSVHVVGNAATVARVRRRGARCDDTLLGTGAPTRSDPDRVRGGAAPARRLRRA